MAIPEVSNDEYGLLPEGKHAATLDDLYFAFVQDAPFSEQRALIFDAFGVWLNLMNQLVPGCRYWVDGGFVTLKQWAPPKDLDVVVVCRPSALNLLSTSEEAQFLSLMTVDDGMGKRTQPMGGLIDGFYVPRGNPQVNYWSDLWAKVRDPAGDEVVGLRKGYLEVIPT